MSSDRIELRRAAASREPSERLGQLTGIDRLDEVLVEARRLRAVAVLGLAVSG
jgi:hypothetical protein